MINFVNLFFWGTVQPNFYQSLHVLSINYSPHSFFQYSIQLFFLFLSPDFSQDFLILFELILLSILIFDYFVIVIFNFFLAFHHDYFSLCRQVNLSFHISISYILQVFPRMIAVRFYFGFLTQPFIALCLLAQTNHNQSTYFYYQNLVSDCRKIALLNSCPKFISRSQFRKGLKLNELKLVVFATYGVKMRFFWQSIVWVVDQFKPVRIPYKNDNKKVLQPIMKSQISHSAQSQNCPNCSERSVALLQLSCSHSFCIKCLTFSYHKFSSSMQRPNLTKCIICERVCELSEEDIQGVGDFTDKVLVPLVKEENEKHSVKSKNDNQYQLSNNEMSAGSKQLKSYELSTEKVTPAPKGFYSRCESPKSAFTQIYCQVHPEQQLSIICFSCGNTLLCISCISNKKHSSHNIKTMAKGIDTIYEQMELSRLKGKEYQDRLQISRRRLEDRRQIIQERWDKTVNTVRLHFNNLLELVSRKCDEVIEEYSSFFSKGLEDAVQDRLKVDQALQHVRRQLERLKDIPKIQTNPIQVIKRSTQLMDEIKDLRQPELQNGDISQCDSDRVVRQVVHLSQKIEKIYPYLRKQTLKTHGIQNYRSQQKLLKENYLKRVKTNVMSLNSSRDKKQKKCTKTEEDEKRYKSKANYKTESNSKVMKVNKALPTYLLQHLDKQAKDAPLPQCLMDLNPLQSSFKSTSKILSKSHIPSAAEQHRRKKEHVAYIKDCLERKQRKTFNGTSKQVRGTAEGMRKKKIPF